MLCVYCQTASADPVDHVPPKLLLSKPYPRDLITVPSCTNCNKSFQTDDEYFRSMVLLREDLATSAHAKPVLERTVRGLTRLDGRPLARRILHNVRSVETPAGSKRAMELEAERIERTLVRFARGLFFHESGKAMPAHVAARAHIAYDDDDEMKRDVAEMVAGQPVTTVGSAFSYTWRRGDPAGFFTAWEMRFYERVPFLVLTIDPPVANTGATGE